MTENARSARINGSNMTLTEEHCQELYGCSLDELDEQTTWMDYVINRVKLKTGNTIDETGVAIIVEEFSKRIKELEEKHG